MQEVNLNGQSLNIVNENVAKLKLLFPEVVTEEKIDFDKLKAVLGDYIEKNDESYRFTWYGKKDAFRKSQIPSTGTLRPSIEDSEDWDTTQNLYIEGDNLEVLKLLQKSYNGRIKMIYIDPPYNKDKDFVYSDKWSDPIKEYKKFTGQIDESGNMTSSDTEDEGGRHTKWLNMMYPRLRLARNLLQEDGVIFISIDDDEQANLKKICDEIFGSECFATTIHVELSATQGMKVKAAKEGNIVKNAEYILVYTKSPGYKNIANTLLYDYRPEYDTHYSYILNDDLETFSSLRDKFSEQYPDEPVGRLDEMYKSSQAFKEFVERNLDKIFALDKVTGFDEDDYEVGKVHHIEANNRNYALYNNGKNIRQLLFLSDSYGPCDDFNASYGLRKIRGNWWKDFYKDMGNVGKEGGVNYNNGKKPVRLIKQLAKLVTKDGDIVLDFFAGSSTTAHAVMELNAELKRGCRFIMVQIPENLDLSLESAEASAKKEIKATIDFLDEIGKPHLISELGKERIRRAGERIREEYKEQAEDLDLGFKVFKLDHSNLKKWSVDVGDDFYKESKESQNAILAEMLGFEVNNFVDGRTELDVVYEVMLKYGLDLSYPVETYRIANTNVYSIGFGGLIICLDPVIKAELAEHIVELIGELEPSMVRVAVRDLSFESDSAKTNFKETLKLGVYAYFDRTDDKADKQNQFKFITI